MKWAFLLSALCFFSTYFWYQNAEKQFKIHNDSEAIAYVSKIMDRAQHRPENISLWQDIENNDSIYSGEAIRTSPQGQIRIHFKDSSQFLDLEADSFIVIQKSKGEIALDLMEGSLFVDAKANNEGTEQLVLNSKNGKVELTGAQVNFSKNGQNDLSVQVLQGKASIRDSSGKSQTIESGKTGLLGSSGINFDQSKIEILTPSVTKLNYLKADANQVSFSWKGQPEQTLAELHLGNSVKSLKKIASSNSIESQEIKVNLAPGKYLWKLVFINPNDQKVISETFQYKSIFQTRLGALALSPENLSQIQFTELPQKINMTWSYPDDLEQVEIIISKNANLSEPIVQEKLKVKNYQWIVQEPLTYYWQINSLFKDGSSLSQPIQSFKVNYLVKDKEPLLLSWNNDKALDKQFYVNDPKITLSWLPQNRTDEIASWKVRYYIESSPENLIERQTNDLLLVEKITRPGRYIASVEAYDSTGAVIGKLAEKGFSIEEKPRPRAPQIIPSKGDLLAEKDGQFLVQWEKIEDSKKYQLLVKSAEGKTLTDTYYEKNNAKLKNLLPGKYSIQVNSIDEFGRPSLNAETRTLMVPDISRVKAPTLKKIKVN